MTDLDLGKLGKRLGETVKADLQSKWEELPDHAKDEIQATIEEYASALLAQVSGEPAAEQTLRELEATIANWSFVGVGFAKRAVLDALANAARVGGEVLMGAAQRLIGA